MKLMSQTPDHTDRAGLAILLKICSGISLIIVAALVQQLAAALPVGQILFFRSAGMVIAVLALARFRNRLAECWQTRRLRAHLVRSSIGFLAIGLNFLALSLLPLSEAQALMYLAPILVVIFGVAWLGERAGFHIWIGAGLGFLGVFSILAIDLTNNIHGGAYIGVIIACLGSITTAAAMIQVRSLARTEPSSTMAFFFGIVSTIGSLATSYLGWSWPTSSQLGLLGLLGLAGALGHIFMAEAMLRATASYLAPFEYLNMVWAIIIALLVFEQIPGPLSLAGIGLIIVAALIASKSKP